MNVASLKLCKELYEVSGWDGTHKHYGKMESGNYIATCGLFEKHQECPAYDAGYLLRKLPALDFEMYRNANDNVWHAIANERFQGIADTPEDALAQLAIELFKQKVLTR